MYWPDLADLADLGMISGFLSKVSALGVCDQWSMVNGYIFIGVIG